jgi:hypothetical protein
MKASGRGAWTRIGAIVLTLGCSLAVRSNGFAGGTGDPNNPYQIATVEDLLSINTDPNMARKSYVLVNDLDLDPNLPEGRVFTAAVIRPFWGTLDGRGHAIRHLCVAAAQGGSAGLFGSVHNALIKDLRLTDVQVSGTSCGGLASFASETTILHCSVTGQVAGSNEVGGLVGNGWNSAVLHCDVRTEVSGDSMVGGLVGHTIPGAQIGDCRASGTVTGTTFVGGLLGNGSRALVTGCIAEGKVTGADHVGGLVGNASFSSVILRCESRADVQGADSVGGLAGWLSDSEVVECRAGGTVAGSESVGGLVGGSGMATLRGCAAVCTITAEQTAGGLIGRLPGGGSIIDSYARGSITGSVIGGLAGDAGPVGFPIWVVNSYAACEILPPAAGNDSAVAGGLFGKITLSKGSFLTDASFWDTELSEVSLGTGAGPDYGGTGLPTQQMQQQDTFQQAGWDFDSTWTMSDGGYPVLRWELARAAEQTSGK